MRSDEAGLFQVGSVCECFACKTTFGIVEGKRVVPSWMGEINAAKEKAESAASLREKFTQNHRPSLREPDLKFER